MPPVESLDPDENPARELDKAIQAHDVSAMRRILSSSPALRSTINDPMPDGSFGKTALLAVVQRSHEGMVDALLEFGADINQKSHWWAGGFGVLDEASPEFAPFLIARGARLEPPAAARLGMIDALKSMIAADAAAVHTRGPDGQMALHDASTIEIAQLLLDHGADIDALDVDHESTPAQYMLRVTQPRHYPRDRKDIARFLVAHGCRTDILLAAALGDLPLVRRHLDANPESIRTRVDDECFPKRNPDAGGTIYIWTLGKNRTAHSVAKEFGHDDVFQFLMEHTPDDLRLSIACELGDERSFEQLIGQNPNFATTLSDQEKRKLPDAAENNNADAVRLMLKAGWPVDAHGPQGVTALHWASFHGNASMVREILTHHPPIDAKDHGYNSTALGWACYGSLNSWYRDTGDHAGTVEALLLAGASAPKMEEVTASEAVRHVMARFGVATA
jgi:ankyrin repeat protein